MFPKQTVPIGDAVLELRGLGCRASGVRDVDLTVRAGEIVGLAGLVGAGRTELARVLFGLTPADAGQILLRGKPVAIDSPRTGDRAGHCLCSRRPPPAWRHSRSAGRRQYYAGDPAAALRAHGRLDFAPRASDCATTMVERLAVKTPSIDTPAGNLSGGNQQKVALARWLATEPAVLILDEPTQGVDVGAKAEIHRLMGELAARGLAIMHDLVGAARDSGDERPHRRDARRARSWACSIAPKRRRKRSCARTGPLRRRMGGA